METENNIEEALKFLERHENLMSLNQIDFFKSVKKCLRKKKKISDKQEAIIFEIRKYLNIEN